MTDITILADGNAAVPGLKTGWGLSLLIGKRSMFDTGWSADDLARNMELLGIDPAGIDGVFISHDHWDHNGGIDDAVSEGTKVYGLSSFSPAVKKQVEEPGGEFVAVDRFTEIEPGLFSTGPLKGSFDSTPVWEHSLVLKKRGGNTLVTGCAHPGIFTILEHVEKEMGESVAAVIGGLHLMNESSERVRKIAEDLREWGIKKIAPTHCTGEDRIKIFEKVYTRDFMKVEAGKVLRL